MSFSYGEKSELERLVEQLVVLSDEELAEAFAKMSAGERAAIQLAFIYGGGQVPEGAALH